MKRAKSDNQNSQKFIFNTQTSVTPRQGCQRSIGPSVRSSYSGSRSATPLRKGETCVGTTASPINGEDSPQEAGAAIPQQVVDEAPKNSPIDSQSERLTAGEKLQLLCLRKEVKRAQSTVDHLLKVNETAMKKHEEPLPHCNPRIVRRVANSVVSGLLLEKEILFPTEDDLKDALLHELGIIPEKDVVVLQEFMKHWSGRVMVPNFYSILRDAMRRRKGTFTKVLREELYVNLGVRKYRRGASLAEKETFLAELQKLQTDNIWRASYVESEDAVDPWGSDAVHAAIFRALYGTHYDESRDISLSTEMAAFCFHVLILAMEDRNLQGNERLVLVGELDNMERKMADWEPYMRRISIHLVNEE